MNKNLKVVVTVASVLLGTVLLWVLFLLAAWMGLIGIVFMGTVNMVMINPILALMIFSSSWIALLIYADRCSLFKNQALKHLAVFGIVILLLCGCGFLFALRSKGPSF